MTFHEHDGVRVALHGDVYEPSDDSHLLADVVRELPAGRLLEVGTGTGLVAIHAARAGHDVVATDVNGAAVRLARGNARRAGVDVGVVRADLTAGLRVAAFDAVVCNPPYLPTGDDERLAGPINAAFDGGRTGIDVALGLLDRLPDGGPPALVVCSTRQDLDRLRQAVRAAGRSWRVVAERKVPHEELRVVRWS